MGTGEHAGEIARRANTAGLAALRAGDGASAVAAFVEATGADPLAGALWRNLAHAHRLTGHTAEGTRGSHPRAEPRPDGFRGAAADGAIARADR